MMNNKITMLFGITVFFLTGCAMSLKMPPPLTLNMENVKQHPYTAGLYIQQSVKEYVYVVATSPVDKMVYSIGNQTAEMFRLNMPIVFKDVVEVGSITSSQNVDLTIEPSIVKFKSVIPVPAYKPYTATIVYHINVYNKKGEKIFAQTTTGEAQTSKGLVSGFSAKSISAEVAQMAMDDAVKKIIEGLSEADELKHAD